MSMFVCGTRTPISHKCHKSFEGLTDILMVELSKHICNYTELLNLGVEVLELSSNQVDSAYHDFRKINEAAFHLLRTWDKQQSSPQEAFFKLDTKFRERNMNQLTQCLNKCKTLTARTVSHGKLCFLLSR